MNQKTKDKRSCRQHKFAAVFLALLLLSGCGGQPAGTVPGTEAAVTDSGMAADPSKGGASETDAFAETAGTDAPLTAATGETSATEETSATAETSASVETSASDETTATTAAESSSTTATSLEPSESSAPADGSGRTAASFNGKPIKVKAVYVSGPMAGFNLDHYISLVDQTELNALVIDIKEAGIVNYDTNAATCRELGLYKKNFKVDAVLAKCHEKGIYVIGRIVVFRDNALAKKKPEYAIKKPDGSVWLENKNKDGAWTSPAIKGVLDYNIEIAKEAVSRGFDEIQFDYVRFPTVPKTNPAVYPTDMPDKINVISGFLKRASDEIKTVREVPVSADVFGIIAESVSDGKAIGQHLEMVGKDVDYLSPMVYPSHYANAGKGVMGNGVGQQINGVLFTAPDLHPYEVVKQTLLKIMKRSDATPGFKAGIRPYLQDFTASYIKNTAYYQTYGATQIRQQIQAVYDAGYEEWILWNGRNIYSESGLLPAEQ